MLTFTLRRFFWFIPVFLVVKALTFFTVRAIPGGPFDFTGTSDKPLPEAVTKNLEQKYGLDQPVWKQYLHYLRDLARLDFGYSYKYRGRPIGKILAETFPISAKLGLLATVIAVVMGVSLGAVAALRHNTVLDHGATTLAIAGISIPSMVLGPLLIWLFVIKLSLLDLKWTGSFSNYLLPAITLGMAMAAGIARLTRASLLQTIGEDYVRTAYAKGLATRVVVVRHALRNSLIPVVTIIGPMFANVVTGILVVEQIFNVPGMGKHFVSSVGNRDYPLILAVTIIFTTVIVVSNLVVDITYGLLDPRIRNE
jgi:ABC-type dipeptide/oligopeptide/nickel transport system permease component